MIPNTREALKRLHVFLKLLGPAGPAYASQSALHRRGPALSDETHLREAMRWLCRAEDVTQGRGVSKQYRIFEGWSPEPYPETTGYILETFLRYWKFTGEREYLDRAVRMGKWEIEIQHASGGVIGSLAKPEQLRTFNTGQVIHGWCSLYGDADAVEAKDERFLQAAVRAADYLLSVQESDGTWQKDSYCGARTYDARVSWALLRVARLTREQKYARAALKNLAWVQLQQQPNGWWQNCGFFERDPITHLIAYTMRGLLESYLLIKSDRALAPDLSDDSLEALRGSVLLAADGIGSRIKHFPALGIQGLPHHSYGKHWSSEDSHSCLTGNVQLAGIFYLLAKHCARQDYLPLADSMVETAKTMQNVSTSIEGIRGGFPGPFPIHKGYDPYCFLNWATKFFADVLLFRLNGFTQC